MCLAGGDGDAAGLVAVVLYIYLIVFGVNSLSTVCIIIAKQRETKPIDARLMFVLNLARLY